jgi:exopolysaccharide biosynthesis WecB/TagA/CpsF family protein
VLLGGLPTVRASRQDLAETMVRDCLAARHVPRPPRIVFSSNGQGIALAGLDGGFHDMMLMADIIHADGMSVVFASKWLTPTPLPERIATTDFFHDAARAAERERLRFFMLGAEEGVSRLAYDNARRRYPRIKWVGRLNGYSGLSDEDICAMIRERRPDVVWVALGKPHQEEFCIRNRQLLVGVGWLKTCGGLFDFLADRRVRAPGWMQQAGLEWLFRAAQEPRRLGMRYLTTNLQAIWFLARRSGMEGGP